MSAWHKDMNKTWIVLCQIRLLLTTLQNLHSWSQGECWLSFAQRPDAHTHGMFARRVETRHVIDVGSNNTPEPPLDIVAPEF